MARARTVVRVTANFESNLAALEAFLTDAGAGPAFDELLTHLAEVLIPNLEMFPRMGRPLLEVAAGSVEAHGRMEALRRRWPDADVREYLTGAYLLLYAVVGESIYLLSIRHHRQLSFDLAAHWGGGAGSGKAR